MILGRLLDNERKVKLNIEIHCTNCGRKVPGGVQTGEQFFQSDEFKIKLDDFKKNYLCGICRDKKRLGEKLKK